MTRKKRAWLSVSLFLVIFAGLLITATFTDLQVSRILTNSALAAHTYLTNASVFVCIPRLSALQPLGKSHLCSPTARKCMRLKPGVIHAVSFPVCRRFGLSREVPA